MPDGFVPSVSYYSVLANKSFILRIVNYSYMMFKAEKKLLLKGHLRTGKLG